MTQDEPNVTKIVTLSASADIVQQDGEHRHDPLGCTLAYQKAIRDVLTAIAAIPKEDGGYCHVLHACDVEAAIEDLQS